MPLKRLLDESRSFNPQAVAVLLKAYEDVVAELGLQAPDQKEKAARLVIKFATSQTDLDPVKLRNAVADSILNKGRPPDGSPTG